MAWFIVVVGKATFADTNPEARRYFSMDNNGQYSKYAKNFGFNEAAMQPVVQNLSQPSNEATSNGSTGRAESSNGQQPVRDMVPSQNDGDGNNVDQDPTGDDGDGPATGNGTDNTTSG